MRTANFRSVLSAAAQAMVPDPAALSTAEFTTYVRWINRWVRDGWERFEWPELCVLEERWYRAFWDVGVSYSIGDEVYHEASDAYYRCIANDTLAEVPGDSPFWEECGVDEADPLDRYVTLDQDGMEPIGTALRMYLYEPGSVPRQAELSFEILSNGIQVPAAAGNSVWLQYRKRPSEFTANRWSNATAYSTGDRVYYVTTGECYIALSAPSTGTAPTNTTYWEVIPLPYVLSRFVEMTVFGEALKDDGQWDKAKGEFNDAEEKLIEEWHKSDSQQRQVRRSHVLTR